MAIPYDVAVGPASSTVPVQTVTVFDEWVLDRNLDDGCSFSFGCMGNSVEGIVMRELETDVWLYDSGVLVDRFRIIEIQQTWGPDGDNRLTVSAICYRRLLASRFTNVDLSYSATSQGQIVWNLIQHTQGLVNGSLGITLGTTGPAILRDRAYPAGTNLLDAIVELSQIENGLTWDIDPNLQLIVSTPASYPLRAQPIQLGTNALSMSKPSGAATFGNVAVVSGDAQTTVVQVSEAATLPTDPRGRWERFRSMTNETSQGSLQQLARGLLDDLNSPQIVWDIELDPSRYLTDSKYVLGDFVTVIQPATVVPSSDPTVPLITLPAVSVRTQVVTLRIAVNADGDLSVSIKALQTFQRWDDVPAGVTWDSLPVSLTWDDLDITYIY